MARLGAELASVTRLRRASAAAIAALLVIGLSGLAGCSNSPAIATIPHCNLTTATVAPQAHPSPPPVPASGAYFGAYSLHGRAIQQNFLASFADLQQDACRPLDIAHVYLQWDHPFPTAYELALARSGHYLLISVKGTDIPEMASGQDDAIITSTARQIAQVHYPVFIEFRWEMDRPNIADVVSSPAAYIAAWDRMRRLFTAAGVTNASGVWCPTAAGFALGRASRSTPVTARSTGSAPMPTRPDPAGLRTRAAGCVARAVPRLGQGTRQAGDDRRIRRFPCLFTGPTRGLAPRRIARAFARRSRPSSTSTERSARGRTGPGRSARTWA